MVISVFRKADCDLAVVYNRFYSVFWINVIFIYIVFVQIITCSLFFVFIIYMIFHLLISFCRCIAQAHNAYADKYSYKKSYNKSQLKHLFHKVYFSPPWGSPTAAIFGCDGSITLDFWLDGSIIIPSACHRRHWIYLSMSESWRYIKYVHSCGLSVPNSGRKVSDVLIFNFQRARPILWKKETGERELTLSPVSSLKS